MSISREEAAAALDSVEAAGAAVRTRRGYGEAAPFLILWGVIWLIAYAATDFSAAAGNLAWMIATPAGALITLGLAIAQARTWQRRFPEAISEGRAIGRRMALLGSAVMAWFPVMFVLAGPLDGRQTGALISVTWAFIYMAAGAFIGWRLFAVGAVTALAIVGGFLFIGEHFPLWMAVVGGGSLIAGGLWLRSA